VQALRLTASDVAHLVDAGRAGQLTKRVARLDAHIRVRPFFLRLEGCSAKDGCMGTGPCTRGLDVAFSLATSWRCREALQEATEFPVAAYLVPPP
jgi:hypothetical protein